MITDEIKRVFFHELGHFIAHEINYRAFHGTGVRSLQLFHDSNDHSKWGGETKVNTTSLYDVKSEPPKTYLAEYLASSVYGCFLESYFSNENVSHCFKTQGRQDTIQWYQILGFYNIDSWKSEISRYELEYFQGQKHNRTFEDFIKLNPIDYLEPQGTGYTINIDKLRNETKLMLEKHLSHYHEFVQGYKTLLEDIFAKYDLQQKKT